MSFFGADPSAIIAHIGSAIGSLAPAPAPQASFTPGQGAGGGGFQPAPMVAGSNAWPTVTIGDGGFQPAELNGGAFQPAGALGGGFMPSGGIGGGFQPSGGIGGSPFSPTPGNPLLEPPKPATTSSGNTPGQVGGASYTGLPPDVAKWAGQAQSTFADLGGYVPDAMLAIIQHESSGRPDAYNAAGNAFGLFQQLDINTYDPNVQFQKAHALAIDKLNMINAAYARLGLNPDDRTRARDLFLAWAGQFDPATAGPSGARDISSGNDGQQFLNEIMPMYDNIVRGKRQSQGGASIPPGPALQTIFGGQNPTPVMQEFGQTDYSTAHQSTYEYGTAYGLPPGSHPGVDYAMPRGSSLYVPVDGTVVYGGGTGYYTDNNGDGPGHGELMIQLANGDQIIMGHMSQINLQPGQHVTAGMLAGLSGGSDGDHLHLEVRQVDHSLPSGYRIVDPRGYFGQR